MIFNQYCKPLVLNKSKPQYYMFCDSSSESKKNLLEWSENMKEIEHRIHPYVIANVKTPRFMRSGVRRFLRLKEKQEIYLDFDGEFSSKFRLKENDCTIAISNNGLTKTIHGKYTERKKQAIINVLSALEESANYL